MECGIFGKNPLSCKPSQNRLKEIEQSGQAWGWSLAATSGAETASKPALRANSDEFCSPEVFMQLRTTEDHWGPVKSWTPVETPGSDPTPEDPDPSGGSRAPAPVSPAPGSESPTEMPQKWEKKTGLYKNYTAN